MSMWMVFVAWETGPGPLPSCWAFETEVKSILEFESVDVGTV